MIRKCKFKRPRWSGDAKGGQVVECGITEQLCDYDNCPQSNLCEQCKGTGTYKFEWVPDKEFECNACQGTGKVIDGEGNR